MHKSRLCWAAPDKTQLTTAWWWKEMQKVMYLCHNHTQSLIYSKQRKSFISLLLQSPATARCITCLLPHRLTAVDLQFLSADLCRLCGYVKSIPKPTGPRSSVRVASMNMHRTSTEHFWYSFLLSSRHHDSSNDVNWVVRVREHVDSMQLTCNNRAGNIWQ